MPKYLWHMSYTTEGVKGLMKEGGSKRRATIQQLLKGLGGRLEAFYYAFGESDVYVIAEVPDAATAAAVSMTINAGGAAQLRTTVLLTPEEIDAATQKPVSYRPPGA